MSNIVWEKSNFKFNKTNEWTDNTGKPFTDYYFTIEESSKRKELLHTIMEQGMQDISNVVVNIEKGDVVLQIQYIWNVDYVPCNDKLLYYALSYIISKRENRHILNIKFQKSFILFDWIHWYIRHI